MPPLHPKAKALLDQMAAHYASLPQPSPSPSEAEQLQAERDSYHGIIPMAGEVEQVHETKDIAVTSMDAHTVPVRLYRPAEGKLPIVLYIHGGSFTAGDFDTHDAQVRMLANRSCALILAVAYRRGPEHPFPAASEDCYAVLEWASGNSEALGADSARIAVVGDSAGGTLATVLTLMSRDRGGPAIRFQALFCPNTDAAPDSPYPSWQQFDGLILSAAGMARNYDRYLSAGVNRRSAYISPLRAESLAGLPPALIITAECDPLRDEGEAYVARLRAEGVEVEHRRYDGMIHGFYQLGGAIDAGKEALEQVGAALRARLS